MFLSHSLVPIFLFIFIDVIIFFSLPQPHLLFFAPFERQISVYYLEDDVNTHSFIYFVVFRGGAAEKRLIVRELRVGRQCCFGCFCRSC